MIIPNESNGITVYTDISIQDVNIMLLNKGIINLKDFLDLCANGYLEKDTLHIYLEKTKK